MVLRVSTLSCVAAGEENQLPMPMMLLIVQRTMKYVGDGEV